MTQVRPSLTGNAGEKALRQWPRTVIFTLARDGSDRATVPVPVILVLEELFYGLPDARRFRKLRGLTQLQLADLAGCSIMYVSMLERGKETAELGKALKVLDALDVEISFTDRKGQVDHGEK